MVVLTTSKTTTSGVLAVIANTTVTGGDVPAVLASVGKTGRHLSMFQAAVQYLCMRNVSMSNSLSTVLRFAARLLGFTAYDCRTFRAL